MVHQIKPLVAALAPFLFALLSALGINLSDDVKNTLVDNLTMVLLGLGVLGSLAPSLRAAWLARNVATETVTEQEQPK